MKKPPTFGLKYKNCPESEKGSHNITCLIDNLFLAVTELHVDMVVKTDMSQSEARQQIIWNVKQIIDENVKEFTK